MNYQYAYIPFVQRHEDGLYYPAVREFINGEMVGDRVYEMSFEAEKNALPYARWAARSLWEHDQRSVNMILKRMKGQGDIEAGE